MHLGQVYRNKVLIPRLRRDLWIINRTVGDSNPPARPSKVGRHSYLGIPSQLSDISSAAGLPLPRHSTPAQLHHCCQTALAVTHCFHFPFFTFISTSSCNFHNFSSSFGNPCPGLISSRGLLEWLNILQNDEAQIISNEVRVSHPAQSPFLFCRFSSWIYLPASVGKPWPF